MVLGTLVVLAVLPAAAAVPAADGVVHIRVNQLGYLPDAPKVAVVCALEAREVRDFTVVDERGRRVLGPKAAKADRPFGPCVATYRLDFSELRTPGNYRLQAAGVTSPRVRIAADVYAGAADTLLKYMRQQRSGFNPYFRDSVHHRTDAILVDHPRAGEWINVSGGWADAADYLQYVTTSAHATYVMLMAYRDHPDAFMDGYQADGLPGANGIPDILDEARHGLEWLVKMYPEDDLMLNQLADDRDHAFLDLPPTDSSDYGWGRGGPRPVYPCTGRPQGIVRDKNRANGYASTAGKYASAMALGARLLRDIDPAFAAVLEHKAKAAYELGRKYPGACQTAPGGAAYFYEEDNWVDDMELGAAQLFALTGEARYLKEAVDYARMEPVTPWMGQDTANHYQWFPWHNNGHFEVWRLGGDYEKRLMADFYRWGLERVAERADSNGFRIGVPFIWCSSNLIGSFATQAYLYRQMTGDESFLEYEHAALDWLFGTNPWGTSMFVGFPADGETPTDPHSVIAKQVDWRAQTGGLIDGPVYASINRAHGLHNIPEDEFAAFNTGHIVYHDDFADYSTNEPIMDGTANLTYLFGALARTGQQAVRVSGGGVR